ncbi:hypothetical protein FRC11_009970 [Ceratobasidium sp. 423]|nr:hypothetical protein FRC11_009970 [Ceratobasidium sp. 423]
MDIIFQVHQHQLDENDLEHINKDLRGFHNNKEIFHLLGAFTSCWSWNSILKLHMAMHWTLQIREYGLADNYDTEITERLHQHRAVVSGSGAARSTEILAKTRQIPACRVTGSEWEPA